MAGEKFLFIQGYYEGRTLTPELAEAQLRKAELAAVVGGGATNNYFRAWDKPSIAVTLAASSQHHTLPLPHSPQGSPDPVAAALSSHSRREYL